MMRRFAAAFGCVVGGGAGAAEAPTTYLYVVNATGRPFHMRLDDEKPSPEMGDRVGVMRPTKPGSYRITGEAKGDPATSAPLDLRPGDLAVTSIGNLGFWCIVIGRRPNAELAFLRASPPQCGEIVLSAMNGLPKP